MSDTDDHQGPSESQTFIARLLQHYSPSTTLQAAWREASDGLQSASASKQTRKSSQHILSLSKVYSEEGKQCSTGTGRKCKEKGKGKKKAEVTQVQVFILLISLTQRSQSLESKSSHLRSSHPAISRFERSYFFLMESLRYAFSLSI